MQHTPVVMLCLLLITLGPQDCSTSSLLDPKPTCCFKFLKKKLPSQLIKSYDFTSSSCSYKAVVFTLKRGKIYCALLEHKWVHNYVKEMNNTNSTPSPN
ncbi:C-C motif chemokine 13-like [Sarcophilus harrisii]|uniref:C-C motif chemokine n=1 Tax=Sarcophilus harrisii TaxID=9305 RepID=G3WKN3_SARHA|nr:C-C motif chemokine 13-like [Sarcophilus harrisii]